MIHFGSVCSGIEAASVAWEAFGWKARWVAEIEPFPCAVLKHHWPEVPNLGDITAADFVQRAMKCGGVQVLVGGTPCQAFSVAGHRRGMHDARGQLSQTFCEIADGLDPSIIVWENVPGVLSDKTNGFGCLLGALCGEDVPLQPAGDKWTDAGCVLGPKRHIAWRIIDAQYAGLAQRRRRVFVVASPNGSGINPSQILFECESMRRDSPPSRKAGQNAAARLDARSTGGGFPGTDGACGGHVVACFGGNNTAGPIDVTPALLAQPGSGYKGDFDSETFVTCHTADGKTADPISANEGKTYSHEGFAFRMHNCVQHPYAFQPRIARNGRGDMGDVVGALNAQSGQTGKGDAAPCVALPAGRVRRLVPEECEKLQGFSVGHTAVLFRGKPAADGPRYKAIGNSMAVNVMRWLGWRIDQALKAGVKSRP